MLDNHYIDIRTFVDETLYMHIGMKMDTFV